MREPNEKIQRLNRTVANVENILPWLNRRLERADKLGADGSPELARQEKSNIEIVAGFYRDKLKTLATPAAKAGADTDRERLEQVSRRLHEIVSQTKALRGGSDGQQAPRWTELSSGQTLG